jgi:hypothetical protein
VVKNVAEEAVARSDAQKASDSMPVPGADTKRAATSTSGSNPPTK